MVIPEMRGTHKVLYLARGSMVPRYLYKHFKKQVILWFCFLLILHLYVAIPLATKLSDIFNPLIHRREMTVGHYSDYIKGRLPS